MRSQRAQLEGELRASVQNDDITESLARFVNIITILSYGLYAGVVIKTRRRCLRRS